MRPFLRICIIAISPALISIPAAIGFYLGYKYFGIQMQVEPTGFEVLELFTAVSSGVLCIVIALPLFKQNQWLKILISLLLLFYGFVKSIAFQAEFIGFLGFYCCRETAPTLFSTLEMAVSPVSPFFMSRYVIQ